MNTSLRCVAIFCFFLAQMGCYQLGSEIPQTASYPDTTKFIGAPAVSNPLPAVNIPAHPYLAGQGVNGMHADSYISQKLISIVFTPEAERISLQRNKVIFLQVV